MAEKKNDNSLKSKRTMTKQEIEGRRNSGWLSDEPMGWVCAMAFLGVYCGLFFGFNGARTAMGGLPTGLVAIMGVGAALGCWCAWSALRELWRRWSRREK